MVKSIPTDHIYSLVRSRLGPDAPAEMLESVSRKVASLLAEGASGEPADHEVADNPDRRLLLIATGRDAPEAGSSLITQLESYSCQVLDSGRASADGYFSLLVSLDMAGCALSRAELAAALKVAGAADGLEVNLISVPSAPTDQSGGVK